MTGSLRSLTAVDQPRVIGSVSIGHGVNEFFSVVIPPVIPLLITDLGISYAQSGLLLTTFFIMYSIFQLPVGMLSDWVGKKRLLIAGFACMSGGILLASVAGSYEMLLAAQAIAGIGGSTFHPTGMSLISDVETEETTGRAMGLFGFGGKIGTTASPILVGGLASIAGWRVGLGFAAILGVLVTLVFIPLFSDDEEPSDSDGRVRPNGGRSISFDSGVQALYRTINVPLTRDIVVLFFLTFLVSVQSRAIQTFTTSYIATGVGGSVSVGNIAFFALLFGGSVSSLWAGSLADRFDRGSLGAIAALATAAMVGGTVLIGPMTDGLAQEPLFAFLTLWFLVIGVVMYALSPVKNALISQESEREFSGSLFGIIQTGSALGSASGPVLFGILASEWGIVAVYPVIAVVSILLACLFFLLSQFADW